jgi:hypothetical protein
LALVHAFYQKESAMRFKDLEVGQWFRFDCLTGFTEYQCDGNGWYGRPYSGGPWHTRANPDVTLVQPEVVRRLEARFEAFYQEGQWQAFRDQYSQ